MVAQRGTSEDFSKQWTPTVLPSEMSERIRPRERCPSKAIFLTPCENLDSIELASRGSQSLGMTTLKMPLSNVNRTTRHSIATFIRSA